MSLLNPSVALPPSRRKAASLTETIRWHAQHAWQVLEHMGQRRAAPELRRIAERIAPTHPEMADQLKQTAQAWSAR